MDVVAYDINNKNTAVELGSVDDGLFVDKLKRSQKRALQVSKPINAQYPNIFDRIQTGDTFGFAGTVSFSSSGLALLNWMLWPNQVPRLAHLSFTQDNQITWLPSSGIEAVDLIEKKGALVIWNYSIIAGGAPSEQKPF